MEQSVRLRARLVVLIGPIASGKSTVARKLIDQLVSDGFTAARTEVDEMAAMIQAPGGLTIEHWHQADVVHGALAHGLSRDRQFLQAAHERFWSVRPQIDPCDLTFDTDTETADSIVSRITDRLYQAQGN
jgi:adenylate kinase family enzyme